MTFLMQHDDQAVVSKKSFELVDSEPHRIHRASMLQTPTDVFVTKGNAEF